MKKSHIESFSGIATTNVDVDAEPIERELMVLSLEL